MFLKMFEIACLMSNLKLKYSPYFSLQLKCRLERMERRMSLLKQKTDGDLPLPSDVPGVTSESSLPLSAPDKALRTPDKVTRR
jgi:hypothetical protein